MGAYLRIFLVWALILIPAFPAFSAGKLAFSPVQDGQPLLSHLKNQDSAPSTVAQIDLNRDGLTEYIARSCSENSAPCRFTVFAKNKKGFITLAEIEAYRLTKGHTERHGVSDLRAYTNKMNDYNSKLYVWDAVRSRYIEE